MGAYGSRQYREDLESLKSNDPRLYSLSLEQVPLGDEGTRLLARALHSNKVLRRLSLGHCGISPAGLQELTAALCDGRSVPPKLRRLELSTSPAPFPLGNPIGDDGAVSIAHLLLHCDSLRHLSLGSCSLGDEGAGIIAQALAGNKSLRTLDLSHNSISDIGAEKLGAVLARNSSLRGLSLWHNRVFHSGAEALANGVASNTTLKWLGLGCNHIGDEGVKALALALLSNAQESQLVWLGLGGNEITDRGAEHLAVALKAQHTNNGHFNEEGETASLTEQIRSGGLRPALELGVTPSHVSLAADSQGEEEEEEGEGPDSEDGEGPVDDYGYRGDWVYCISLESVGLGGNQITNSGAVALADGLKSNTSLLSLGLADNLIGDEGAAALAELVRQSDTLESLVLSGNEIGNEGGSMLIAALAQNTSLRALYMAHNPLGDEVSKRCLEVVGHHNHTLQLLDVHNTRMSTPAVYSLVEGMQKEGILRALGSQPLPLRSDDGGRSHDLPATGNMLEMQNWQPPSYHTVLLQKQGKRFTTTAPSQRYTTYALGSLPAPEETAQALVIKEAESEGGAPHKRRQSLSHFFRRKFSRKKDTSVGSYDIHQETPHRNISKRPTSGHELHTLSENEEEEEEGHVMESVMLGGPVFEETIISSQLSDEPFINSTFVSSEQSFSAELHDHPPTLSRQLNDLPSLTHNLTTHDQPTDFSSPPMLTSDFNGPPTLSTDFSGPLTLSTDSDGPPTVASDFSGPPTLPGISPALNNVDSSITTSLSNKGGLPALPGNQANHHRVSGNFDSITSEDQLSSLTKTRARPANRRPPSRQRTPSPSPRRHESSAPSPGRHESSAPSPPTTPVTRVGGITGISADSANVSEEAWPDLDATTMKQQWRATLQKRVGILNMGSFLHTGYESVNSFKPRPPLDVSYASLPRNHAKNRSGAPLPPAHSRVKLQLVLEEVGSDYINANYVGAPGLDQSKIIVTQAPLDGTTRDFWRMIWEQRTSAVVVIATEDEGQWWPKGQGGQQRHSLVIGRGWVDSCLIVKFVGKEYKGHYTVYRLSLESIEEQESDSVLLFHFTEWPQHAVPNNSFDGICDMYEQVLKSRSTQPVVVVSELGAGRAGCFSTVAVAQQIMTDSANSVITGWKYDPNIVDMVIRGLRSCRGNLVENQRQYEFCHHLLEKLLVGGARKSETPPTVAAKAQKKTSKWRLFHGKSSADKVSDKHVTFGKQKKQDKKTLKASSKGASKSSVSPEVIGLDTFDEEGWGDTLQLMW